MSKARKPQKILAELCLLVQKPFVGCVVGSGSACYGEDLWVKYLKLALGAWVGFGQVKRKPGDSRRPR